MARDSSEFQVFAKPIGPLCNLDCRYCYYLKKRDLYPRGESFRMADDLLEEYIVQQIRASAQGPIVFAWHGGEPTLLGLDYFRRIVELQRAHQPAGRRIVNGLQTNGILLDEQWCRFFSGHGFHVGLSLDGPAELHDGYRTTQGEKPTHRDVMRAYRLLRQHRVLCDLLCVVHAQNVRQPLRVYRFFKEIKAQYLGLLPLVERRPGTEGGVSDRSVPPEALGQFLCTIFDEWLRQDIGTITLQMFEEVITTTAGIGHSLCIFRKTCGDVPVVEHDGDFFSCDHFVDPEHRLGNIRETALAELLESPEQRSFGEAKWHTLPRLCRACEVRSLCHGGCPKDRFAHAPDGEPGLNYLCAGFKRFFTHSRPHASMLVALRRAGASPEGMMQAVRAADAPALPKTGRNAPCPCGSGRKYKHCCLGKRSG